MKNIRIFIKEKDLEKLQAYSDECYLYNYIVNNYTELDEENIFRNYNIYNYIKDIIFIAKDNISEDDEFVWNETSKELKKKNIFYYTVILDPKNGSFFVYNNLKEKIPYVEISKNTGIYDAINKIEKYKNEITNLSGLEKIYKEENMNKYQELKEKHQKAINKFPIKYAFSDEQFKKGMEELGLKANDYDKVTSIGIGGGFIRKEDVDPFLKLMKKNKKELQDAISEDKTGEGFIKDMFIYELNNHEYCITHDLEDTFEAIGITFNDINKNENLKHGLELAKKEYLKEINNTFENEDCDEEDMEM